MLKPTSLLLLIVLLLSGCAASRFNRGVRRGQADYARYTLGKKRGYDAYGVGYWQGMVMAIQSKKLTQDLKDLKDELKKLDELSEGTTAHYKLEPVQLP